MKTNLRLIGGKKLQSPNNSYTRPTTLRVREAIFNILNNRVENSNWLDLFSGTGAISCEAYNHGARKILAIEKNKINSKIFHRFFQIFPDEIDRPINYHSQSSQLIFQSHNQPELQ